MGAINIKRNVFKDGSFRYAYQIDMAALQPVEIMDAVIAMYHPKTVLDIGCGVGKSLDYFLSKDIDCQGVDGSRLAIARSQNSEKIRQHNLNIELNLGTLFDLVWSFEFIEHIHPKYVDTVLKTFSNHSDVIVLAAARPGQGGDGHLNEKDDQYWVQKFNNFGYSLNKHNTSILRSIPAEFSQNMYVFERLTT